MNGVVAVGLIAALVLSGCATVPKLGPRPEPRAAESFAAQQSLHADAAPWPSERWWIPFGDEQLNRLIDEGLRDSPTMAIASARVLRSEGLAQAAGAALLPSVIAGGAVAYSKPSYNTGIPIPPTLHGWNEVGRLGLDVGFELDFWGKNRAALAAAVSETRAAEADLAAARLLLSTAIADVYSQLSALHADRDVLERTVAIREKTLTLVSRRHAFGYDSEADLRQAEAGPPTTRAQLIQVDERIALTRSRLSVLLGAGPDRADQIVRPAARAFGALAVPSDLPAELLGRRPDLVAARWRAQAASRRIDVAVAQFRPNINLIGAIGRQALGLEHLFAGGSTVGSIGPAVSLPIFDGGRRAGGYRVARAEYDAAVASYDATLNQAIHDVSDVLLQQRAVTLRLQEERLAVTANDRALALAQSRFTAGAADLQSVLIAEDRLLATQRLLAADESRRLSLEIALIRALGGGWSRSPGGSVQ